MVSATYPKNKKGDQGSIILMFRDKSGDKHRFLSNFYPCDVTLPAEDVKQKDGSISSLPAMKFTSTETAYMAWKTTNLSVRKKIQNLSPADAKELTHSDDFILRDDYSDDGRIHTMLILVEQKFSKENSNLRTMLLETDNKTIIEGNIWGDDFFGLDLETGEAKNYLGKILMYVRDNLRKEEGLQPVSHQASKWIAWRRNNFTSSFKSLG